MQLFWKGGSTTESQDQAEKHSRPHMKTRLIKALDLVSKQLWEERDSQSKNYKPLGL